MSYGWLLLMLAQEAPLREAVDFYKHDRGWSMSVNGLRPAIFV